jgi:hypothetical protein
VLSLQCRSPNRYRFRVWLAGDQTAAVIGGAAASNAALSSVSAMDLKYSPRDVLKRVRIGRRCGTRMVDRGRVHRVVSVLVTFVIHCGLAHSQGLDWPRPGGFPGLKSGSPSYARRRAPRQGRDKAGLAGTRRVLTLNQRGNQTRGSIIRKEGESGEMKVHPGPLGRLK